MELNNYIMKKRNRFRIFTSLLMGFLIAGFSSCKDDESQKNEHDPNKPIVLTDFYPKEGGIATKMVFSGENFGTDVSKINVYFNDTKAAVVRSTGEKMYVITPRKPGEDCTITVSVGDNKVAFDEHFTYHIQTTVTTLCGMKGTPGAQVGNLAETQFPKVTYLAIDTDHNIFVCCRELDSYYDNNKVMLVNELEDKSQILIPNTGAPLNQPCIADDGQTVYIPSDAGMEYWVLSSENMWIPRKSSLRKDPSSDDFDIKFKHSFAMCKYDGFMYTRAKDGTLLRFDPSTGYTMAVSTQTKLMAESDSYIVFSPIKGEEHILYLAYTNSHCIYTYNLKTGEHKLYAGMTNRSGYADGPCEYAMFNEPRQMIVSADNELYLADTNNHVIRKISQDGIVSTVIGLAGQSGFMDGTPEEALFDKPFGVALDTDGTIYIGDSENQCVRRLAIE